jgi:membrane-bound lytic murein transglycosylase B
MKTCVTQHRITAPSATVSKSRAATWYQRSVFALNAALAGLLLSTSALAADHPGTAEYIDKIVAEHQLDRAFVEQIIQQAEYRQDIIDLMTRPAEGKPWHEYRKIFLNDRRIKSGAVFMTGNQDLLSDIEQRFGVPAEIVTAITGIETSYGGNTGRHRVIDALVTLGFYYPKRAEFFSSELTNLLRLSDEESLPLLELRGSYAGAMGLGQFMPSSYRAYAVDFDKDGRRDLWQSLEDALASVANYLHEHRWQSGQPVVLPATVVDESKLPAKPKLKLEYTLGQLAKLGVTPLYGDLPADTKAMLVKLEREDGYEYWIGLNNFYAITRYNRSPLYAMAVFQLSQAIVDTRQASQSAASGTGEAK